METRLLTCRTMGVAAAAGAMEDEEGGTDEPDDGKPDELDRRTTAVFFATPGEADDE